jgi:hypothetical protein
MLINTRRRVRAARQTPTSLEESPPYSRQGKNLKLAISGTECVSAYGSWGGRGILRQGIVSVHV